MRLLRKLLRLPIEWTAIKVAVYKDNKKRKKERKREALLSQLKEQVSCRVYDCPKIFMGQTQGSYRDGTIIINSSITGVMLIDTMFHEHRHHEQRETSHRYWNIPYITGEQDMMAYYDQPVEVDARRHAYVKTVRFLKENYPEKVRHLWVYRKVFHPFHGWARPLIKLEAKLRRK